MRYHVEVGARSHLVDVGEDGIAVDGAPVVADLAGIAGSEVRSLIVDGRSYRIVARRHGGGVWDVHLGGRRYRCEAVDERARLIRRMAKAGARGSGPKSLRAPMPGLVVRVEVTEGDRVEVGQGVVIVEAMKMENELRADAGGVVARVLVRAGEAVEKDQILVAFAAEDAPADEQGGT